MLSKYVCCVLKQFTIGRLLKAHLNPQTQKFIYCSYPYVVVAFVFFSQAFFLYFSPGHLSHQGYIHFPPIASLEETMVVMLHWLLTSS